MKGFKSIVLLACLALLAGASVASACTRESECPAAACGSAYDNKASDFPFDLDYTTTGDKVSTTFVFKVCSTGCDAADPYCQPLKSFRLRFADAVLATPSEFVKMANPEGSIVSQCTAAGKGWFVSDSELLSLNSQSPAEGEACELFSVSVYNPAGTPGPLALADVCQQDVVIQDGEGATAFEQSVTGPSCLFTFELEDGTSGVGALKSTPPTVSPSPSPLPSPTPSPVPVPSPGPTPYYGGYSRRLQQAPRFVRGLLSSGHYYYGPSSGASRRLSAAAQQVPESLAFATRRLMEASAVPLPLRLVAADAAHRSLLGASEGVLGSSGRKLSAYPYYGHRRSALSAEMGQEALFGAPRHLSSYYYGGHRRSMLSVGMGADSGFGATPARTLSSYYYGGHRRSMLSVSTGADTTLGAAGRTLSSYYYGSGGHRRSMLSVGADATLGATGRTLSSYYYGSGGHRRSMLSTGLDSAFGSHAHRQLASYYYGGSSHRRSMLSVGQEAELGSGLGRTLNSYYYGGSKRRSLMSVGQEVGLLGRRLSSYYYGSRR